MNRFTKKLFTILLVLFVAGRLFAVEGVVTYVKGKVEVKRNNTWISLKVGDKVAQSEVLNTGFQSEAKVKLMNNILYLGPVTRVTLSTLATDEEKDKVNVFLSTGTVRSKVNRTDTKRVSYTIRTPIAVASVRGTDVTVTSGNKIYLEEGKVAVNFTSAEKDKAKKALKKKIIEEEKAKQEKIANGEEPESKGDNEKTLEERLAEVDNLSDDELLSHFENDPTLSNSGVLLTPSTEGDLSGNAPLTAPKSSTAEKADDIMNTATDASSKEAVKNETPIIKQEITVPEVKVTTGGINVGVQLDTGSLEVEVGIKN